MTDAIGDTLWAIAEGFVPSKSLSGGGRPFVSHEAACILNAGDVDAHIEVTIYIVDREAIGGRRPGAFEPARKHSVMAGWVFPACGMAPVGTPTSTVMPASVAFASVSAAMCRPWRPTLNVSA